MEVETITNFLTQAKIRVELALEKQLPAENKIPLRLHQAMRYAVLNGGKRLRPALLYATAELFTANAETLDHAACALELIHCYSLVHDDLPAMDNDVLRRGKPTCHIAFDEATAILTGDALQSLAFECLAKTNLEMVAILAKAIGSQGMAGGQAIDIDHVGRILNIAELTQMHRYKTGALISAAVEMGAVNYANAQQHSSLKTYAEKLGLAFQVQDDILDIEAETETLGKTAGKDMANNKPTFPGLLGLTQAKTFSQTLSKEALDALSIFDARANHLRALAEFSVQRRY